MSLEGDCELVDGGFDQPPGDPLDLFTLWLSAAQGVGVSEPNSLVLATAGRNGKVSSRVVLLKGVSDGAFVFATSGASPKGREIEQSGWGAGTLWWRETMQQVNFAGPVEPVAPAVSDELFRGRTREAQAVAIVSQQSEVLDDEEALARRVADLVAAGGELERPPQWQGYRLTPEWVEFWHGRPNRIHRRLRYDRAGSGWASARLQP